MCYIKATLKRGVFFQLLIAGVFCAQLTLGQARIISFDPPEAVRAGEIIHANVVYESSQPLLVFVVCQESLEPWTKYASESVHVDAGRGTASIAMQLAADMPVAEDSYRFRVVLIPKGGAYSDQLDMAVVTEVSCVDGEQAMDQLIAVKGPDAISPRSGEVIVNVDYQALENRTIRVDLLQNRPPWQSFGTKDIVVQAGRGSAEIPIAVDPDIPLMMNAYTYSVNIIPAGESVDKSVDIKIQHNISCVDNVSGFTAPKRPVNKAKPKKKAPNKKPAPILG